MWVAPYAGAWIEILDTICRCYAALVAPYAGAWIEILISAAARTQTARSLPTRERGLK